jgi:glycosyltransferase involved in cell wall biosynthesis
MKIRLLIDARLLGGVEIHVMNLCEGLVAKGHDCQIVFVRHYPDSILYDLCHDRQIVYQVGKSSSHLFQSLMAQKVDIIHTHGYKANVLGRLMGLLSKSTIVSTFHTGEKPLGRLIVYNFLDRRTGFLSHNICVNAKIASHIPSRTTIIPNFVSIPPTPNPLKTQGPWNIYFIGRFSPEKGPAVFCKMATPLPDHFQLHMAGDGPLLKTCQTSWQKRIHFHGNIKAMNAEWKNVDLLCITSAEEGLPLVLLEAMSRGIPVVSFDVGSIREVITDRDYVVQSMDQLAMRDCIATHFMTSLEEREMRSQRARTQIINTFSDTVVVPQIEALYRKSLNEHSTQ